MKVLITIGSMVEKKFTRLLKIIDELCEEKVLDGNDVVVQVGFDNYESKNFRTFDMLPDDDFKQQINNSDVVISHAGTGTVTACLKRGKKVIIFPRMSKYDEHYDDHQQELAELFTRNNYVLCAESKKELVDCINKLDYFKPSKFISNNKKMNKIVIDFIESELR